MRETPKLNQPATLAQTVMSLPGESVRENYNHITLTEDEAAEALRIARRTKDVQLRNEAYSRKLTEPVVYPVMNSEQLLSEVIERGAQLLVEQGKGFVLDEENYAVFELLSLYFSNDARFEEKGYSLNKGIYLFGDVGCGKTLAMRLFSMNTRQSFATVECRAVADAYKRKGGDELITKYQAPIQNSRRDLYYGQRELGWCFDDFGTENKAKNFGNEKNTMEDVFMSWYLIKPVHPMVHFTSNLSVDEIEEFYGIRLRSRMREMFNLIEFPDNAKDRRV